MKRLVWHGAAFGFGHEVIICRMRPGETTKPSKKRAGDVPGSSSGVVAPAFTQAEPQDSDNKEGVTKCFVGARAAIADTFKKSDQHGGMTGTMLMLKTPKKCRRLIK